MQFPGLTSWAGRLDDFLRLRDFAAGRTAGGILDRRLGIRRHTPAGLILPAALCFFAVLASPSLPRLGWAALTAVFILLLLAVLMAAASRTNMSLRADLYLQIVVVSLVVLLIWCFSGDEYSDAFPYRNLLLPVILAAAGVLFLAAPLSRNLFDVLRNDSNYSQGLQRAELFADRGPVIPITGAGLLTAFFTVPFRGPLELLIFPAIAALLARPEWLNPIVLITFAACFAALMLSGLNDRFGTMWVLFGYALLHGGALLVSLIMIVLAAARYAGVSYVTTVFDTAAGWVISTVLLSAYVLSWWFNYWINRLLSDQVIRIIDPNASSGEVSIPYAIDPDALATRVPADGRVLQIHGSSRLVVIRDPDQNHSVTFFQAWPALDLLNAISLAGSPGGRAIPTFSQIRGRSTTFKSIATSLFIFIVVIGSVMIHDGPQDPELATKLNRTGGIPPSVLLAKPADDHTIFVIAASGGGTRAALFTTAILEGIASRGKVADIVLGSGVSGGGAALAYFTGFRRSLLSYDPRAWATYYNAMKAPYIRDVLERASEWRMVTSGRLGMLLRESFSRTWSLDPKLAGLDTCPERQSVEGCEFGLILNSTLAGHLDLNGKVPAGGTVAEIEPKYRSSTSGTLAGGRLIYTNLDLTSGFAGGVEPDDSGLPIVVRGPSASLEQGAALNANFPPVFANAAVDLNNQDRYWVTDGGAADNRGMEMALYSIRRALATVPEDQLPRLFIIVADSGGYSDAYSQDRGVSSALGSGAHFASALDSQLKSAIETLYAKHPDRFGFSYVYMPRPLRTLGSFGTHWMLQDRITVRHRPAPQGIRERLHSLFSVDDDSPLTITGEEMINVLRSLYVRAPLSFQTSGPGADKPLKLSPDGCKILQWARSDSSPEKSRAEWLQVIAALGDTAPDNIGCP